MNWSRTWLFVFSMMAWNVFAASVVDLGVLDCSGEQHIDTSAGLSMSCVGDYVLREGELTSDLGISITATGSLLLESLSISGFTVLLEAGSDLIIGEGTSFLVGESIALAVGDGGLLSSCDAGSLRQSTIINGHAVEIITPCDGQVVIDGLDGELSPDSSGVVIVGTPVPLPGALLLLLSAIGPLFGRAYWQRSRAI